MALGVSSYSARRRRRAEPGPYGPKHPLRNFLAKLEQTLLIALPMVRLPLSLAAVAHLALVAFFPGGQNTLFGVEPGHAPPHTSLFKPPDALGFYTTSGTESFLVYKIYTQDGGVVDGVFPDTKVAPRLRFDRWAATGDAMTGPYPALHDFAVRYIVRQLPSPPVRMELYAARWGWDRAGLAYPWPGDGPQPTLELRRLGSYNGLTRSWEPVETKARRQ